MEYGLVINIYYDKINNFFIDSDGTTIMEIFHWITPNDILLFKHSEKNFVVAPYVQEPLIGIVILHKQYPDEWLKIIDEANIS